MPKFDGTRYPDRLTAEDAVEIAEVLANEFNGTTSSEEAFAQALGHSTSNSGAYITKVADARNYGVLPSQGLEIEPLGQRVANPRDADERREALFEMYQNVPILRELYEHLDGREPPNQLWSVLIEITDAERNEAKDVEDDILQLYNSMLEYDVVDNTEVVSQDSPQPSNSEDSDQEPVQVPAPSAPDSAIYLKVGEDEHRFGELTAINIEIAQKILDSKKREFSRESGGSNSENQSDKDGADLGDFS